MTRGVLEIVLTTEVVLIVGSLLLWGVRTRRDGLILLGLAVGAVGGWFLLTLYRDSEGYFHAFVGLPLSFVLAFGAVTIVALALHYSKHEREGGRQRR